MERLSNTRSESCDMLETGVLWVGEQET
jgi:hypothetical protein